MIKESKRAIYLAILAAVLYGVSAPISKILLEGVPPTFMASFLYLGAGIGMILINAFKKISKENESEASMTKNEAPYIVGMIVLDILAPLFLMYGLRMTTSAQASLLNNFEIVATSILALIFFKEAIGKRMWLSIIFITLSSIILTFENTLDFSFSLGSILVILACVCWGLENNCTRMLSLKNPLQIVMVKGLGSGFGALIIAMISKERIVNYIFIPYVLLLGFFAYGLSIFFYVKAQRVLGAARTSAYYAAAPFIGVLVSWILFRNSINLQFLIALIIMMFGAYLAVSENHNHKHHHVNITHNHKHSHNDLHHNHIHQGEVVGEHTHIHTHEEVDHTHPHTPDLHHTHSH